MPSRATFAPDAEWSLLDHYRIEELVELLGREVDQISKEAVDEKPNAIVKGEIPGSPRRQNCSIGRTRKTHNWKRKLLTRSGS